MNFSDDAGNSYELIKCPHRLKVKPVTAPQLLLTEAGWTQSYSWWPREEESIQARQLTMSCTLYVKLQSLSIHLQLVDFI